MCAFRLVLKHPSRMKRCFTDVPIDFTSGAGAVCVHDVISVSDCDTSVTVSLQPSVNHRHRESVAYSLSVDIDTIDHLRVWDRHPAIVYSSSLVDSVSPGAAPSGGSGGTVDSEWMSASLSACIAAGAWSADGDTALELDLRDAGHTKIHDALAVMSAHAIVTELPRSGSRRAWQITPEGAASIQVSVKLVNPRGVADPREGVSVMDMTINELILMLLSDGWAIQLFDRKRSTLSPSSLLGDAPHPMTLWLHGGENLPCKGYLLVLSHWAQLKQAHVEECVDGRDS